MVISDEQLLKFQEIYKNYYGKEISKDKAYEQGIKLITLLKIIYKPLTESEFAAAEEQQKEILLSMMEENGYLPI